MANGEKKNERKNKEREQKNKVGTLFLLFWGIILCIIPFYAYFKTGNFKIAIKTSEDMINSKHPIVLSSMLVIFLTLLIMQKYPKKTLKCTICGNPGKDLLNCGDRKMRRLCRIHLLEEFKRKFLEFGQNMVVLYPGLEGRKQSYHKYLYCTKERLKKYNLDKLAGHLLEQGLRSISGKCKQCGAAGTIAYFGKGSFEWQGDFPLIENITQEPEIMCKKCTLDLILPSLRDFKGHFHIPLEIPINEEGIFLSYAE